MPKLRKPRKKDQEAANPLLAADREGREEHGADGTAVMVAEAEMNGDKAPETSEEQPGTNGRQAAEVRHAPPAMAAEPSPPAPMREMSGGTGGESGGGVAARVLGVYADPGSTAAQREAAAAAEFQAAIAPVMDLLTSAVPEAGSPDEAMRTLESRLGEYPPDPDGGAYIRGDSYETDARVYYRLLRRDYERNPRPLKGPRSPFRTLPSAWRGP